MLSLTGNIAYFHIIEEILENSVDDINFEKMKT